MPISLFSDKVTGVDSGFYSCAAVSSSGSVMSRAELRVVSSATALKHPPIIELGPANQVGDFESSFQIKGLNWLSVIS